MFQGLKFKTVAAALLEPSTLLLLFLIWAAALLCLQ
jgi:hypothetical protein